MVFTTRLSGGSQRGTRGRNGLETELHRLGVLQKNSRPSHRPPAARSNGSSAPRGALSYPRHSREELGGRFLGLMAYLDPKG